MPATYAERARDAVLAGLPDLEGREWSGLVELYALLVFVKGETVTAENVHDAWSLYVMGGDPHHPCLVPFSELSEEFQRKDDRYAEAIRSAARSLKGRD